ncbi:hypothetical protein Sango_1023700 [Sesamum angolense]|uniref:RNase H type-1 domain-containing protein n=1 Tax=Sesamum angolense TaxID=2727404 RepID=A0AAE2BZ63_9LAMI|nr:hypothetical protein Sango_1023700 [Sesamum angolense]
MGAQAQGEEFAVGCILSIKTTLEWSSEAKLSPLTAHPSSLSFISFQNPHFVFQFRCYSSKKSSGGSSRKRKLDPKPVMKDDKEAFFVVRKGDLVGVYKSLSDCQAQVGTSELHVRVCGSLTCRIICDPAVSVYKGYSMPKDTEKYLISCGLKNALYSIRASDLTEELFGTLVSCPFQPSSSRGETSSEPVTKKRSQEALWSEYGETVGPMLTSNDALTKHFKLEPHRVDQNQSVCVILVLLNSGLALLSLTELQKEILDKLGQELYYDPMMEIWLREGLGIATNNVAEYRGFILGLKYALGKGFTSVRVRGDSKLVCMQIQGLWKVKNQNISNLYEEAKKLKDSPVIETNGLLLSSLKDLNSEADAQANLAVDLAGKSLFPMFLFRYQTLYRSIHLDLDMTAEGQVQEEIDK